MKLTPKPTPTPTPLPAAALAAPPVAVPVVGKPARKTGSLWRTLIAVLWSFLGVRKDSDYQQDIATLTPLHIIGVGIAACFVFVISLMMFVKYVVV